MNGRRKIFAAVSLSLPMAAAAHLPPGATGPNGGQVQVLGPHHGELVAKDGELTLFLFDHRDRPLDASQASGTALVMSGGRQQSLVFAPRADGLALLAAGDFAAAPGLRVVVQVIAAPGAAQTQARFTPAGLPR